MGPAPPEVQQEQAKSILKQAVETASPAAMLSLGVLGPAVALTLGVGFFMWAQDILVWPTAGARTGGVLATHWLLIYAVVSAGVLLVKEAVVRNKAVTLCVNLLAVAVSLGYLALYYVTIAMVLFSSFNLSPAT